MELTEEEIAYFRAISRMGNADAMLAYAIKQAERYAQEHAHDMPEFVRQAIAVLHVRYAIHHDIGERRLIRAGIDSMLHMGEAIRHA